MKADLKLGNAGLADLISTMLGGANPIDFEYKGQRYKVLMQLKKEKRIDTKVIDNLFILSSDKKIIPFSNIATIKPSVKPSTLVHYNQMKSIDITAELAPNYSMSHVLPQINKELKANLPEDIKYQYGGDIADFLQSKGATITAFLTALLFIYLILCAQFESFVMPFIVLLTVPISLVGALLSLKLFGGSLNIYSNIGMVTLIGLISKRRKPKT
jgi:multidrug efflux pump